MARKVRMKKKQFLRYASKPVGYISPDLQQTAVLIEDLLLDPRNPRRGDVEMVANSLQEHGQQKPITIYGFPDDKGQFRVITGNHTTKAAMSLGWKYISAVKYRGSEEKAQAWALVDNRSSDVATYDDETLAGLLKDMKDAEESFDDGLFKATGYSENDLSYLLSRIELDDEVEEYDDDVPLEEETFASEEVKEHAKKYGNYDEAEDNIYALVENKNNPVAIYPSDSNKYEIPDLLPNMLADPPQDKIVTFPGEKYAAEDWDGDWYCVWGYSLRGAQPKKSILSFYTEDDALMKLWNNPSAYAKKIGTQDWHGVIAPAFSIYMADPFPVRIYNMYAMQWVARYWQQVGIKVIPDVPVPIPRVDYRWQCAGIPVNAPCISMTFQTGVTKADKPMIQHYVDSINHAIEVLKPQSLLLYGSKLGHETTWNQFPSSLHVIRVATMQDVRRNHYMPDPISSLVDTYDPKYVKKKRKAAELLKKERAIESRKSRELKKRRDKIKV